MRVYLDNAATTRTAPEVVEAMQPYMLEKYGNPSSLHAFGRNAKQAFEDAREKIADSINADLEEVVFTSGGSESDNLAIKGLAYAKKKGHILTTVFEHPAVLETCRFLEKNHGFDVTYLGVKNDGLIDIDKFQDALTSETILVSVMHANNEIGTIQDINAIADICMDKDISFHTDAVQSYTKEPFDASSKNIAFASFSAHKIHGPKGIGALYIRSDMKKKIEKQVHGGHHESNLRPGTENVAGAVGMAKAVELVRPEHLQHMKKLRDHLIDDLLTVEETHLNGSRDRRLVNNASISFHKIEGESILLMLDQKGIAVSTGSACSSASLSPSHVLTAIGLNAEIAHGTIRFSLSRYTTQEEIDYTISAAREVVEKLREMSPLWKK